MSRFHLIAAFALSLTTTACAVGSDDEAPADSDRFLSITEHVDDAVRGAYMTVDGEIDFSFERTAEGGVHAILTSKQFELINVTIDARHQDIRLMGDAHRFIGESDRAVVIDRDLLAEMAALPEMRHLPELRDALLAAGIDSGLLGGVLLEPTLGTIGCRVSRDPRWTWVSELASEAK
jgi:hypothetical protein